MAVQGRIAVNIDLKDIVTSGLEQGTNIISTNLGWDVAAGVAALQIDKMYQGTVVMPNATPVTVDVVGSLTNLLGGVVLVKIKFLFIYASPGNTTNVTFSKGANGPDLMLGTTPSWAPLTPGGGLFWFDPSLAGVTCTAATKDLLTFTNSAASPTATVTLILGGTSS